jgi:hypothetical protein
MHMLRIIFLVTILTALIWFVAGSSSSAQSEQELKLVRIVGLGNNLIPNDASGTPYLPTRDDRQMTFDSVAWQSSGEVVPVLLSSYLIPKQVTICGNRLSVIQGSLKNNPNEDIRFFPLTINGTSTVVPDEGCYSVTL